MSGTPKISIIVPVFNGEKYIYSCIDGVVAQDFDDFELCFVIDHKTHDNSEEMVKKRMEEDGRIRYIIQEDDGRLGFARNLGVQNTTGEYIWFLDVDDVPFPTFIKDMTSIMDETSSDMVFCNFFSSSNRIVPEFTGDYSNTVMDRVGALKARASGKLPVTSWSMVYRRSLIVDNDLKFKSGLAEDLDFTYRALDVSSKVTYTNKPEYLYYQNPNSICNSENENKRADEELAVYKSLFDHFKEKDSEFYDYFVDRAIISVMRCMSHYDKRTFLQNYKCNWVRPMLIDMKKSSPFAETFIFKHFPRMYHLIVKTGMKKVYKENLFDNSTSSSTFKRWFKKKYQDL
ncbi:MAG: glycosyltransferase [Candidatus Methanomethylophilaceae archaeon]|nr:glycosyltransferase [Candidatus Methanomethylophilaceae archaeon]